MNKNTVLRYKQSLYHVIIIVKGFIIMGNLSGPPFFIFIKLSQFLRILRRLNADEGLIGN